MPRIRNLMVAIVDETNVDVTAKSLLSGVTRTVRMKATMLQFQSWTNGALIQDCFPDLTADQREFIMTGASPEEWDEEFGGDGDDE
jgi:hypothetical protein